MGCQSTFTIAPAVPPMPLDDAVVYNDDVFGVMGPYVLQFDGDNGGLITSARIASPMLGDCRITTLGTMLYVSTWNNPAHSDYNLTGWETARAGIYPVDPTTLTPGTLLDVWTLWPWSVGGPLTDGGRWIHGAGAYLYLVIFTFAGVQVVRVDPLNTADKTTLTAIPGGTFSMTQQCALSATKIYVPTQDDIESSNLDGTLDDTIDTGTLNTIACAFSTVNSCIYAVTGSTTLVKVDEAYTTVDTFDLSTVQADVKPFRLKYNPADDKIYIPCQSEDCVIIWNPATDTGVVVAGFDSPIDVVFTSTRIWAVQNGITPLVEVVPP